MRKGMHIQKSSHHTTSAAPIRLQRSLRKVSRALYAVLCITLPLLHQVGRSTQGRILRRLPGKRGKLPMNFNPK